MADAAFWARKRLSILPGYQAVRGGDSAAEAHRFGLPLGPDEALIGLYTNLPGAVQDRVAVTSAAVATHDGSRWSRVPYASLVQLRLDGEKGDWDVITLVDTAGREWPVHMPGEPAKPVTSLATFLTKVSCAARVVVNRPEQRQQPWFGPGGRREVALGSPYPAPAEVATAAG